MQNHRFEYEQDVVCGPWSVVCGLLLVTPPFRVGYKDKYSWALALQKSKLKPLGLPMPLKFM